MCACTMEQGGGGARREGGVHTLRRDEASYLLLTKECTCACRRPLHSQAVGIVHCIDRRCSARQMPGGGIKEGEAGAAVSAAAYKA